MRNYTVRTAKGKSLRELETALSAFRIFKAIRLNGEWVIQYG